MSVVVYTPAQHAPQAFRATREASAAAASAPPLAEADAPTDEDPRPSAASSSSTSAAAAAVVAATTAGSPGSSQRPSHAPPPPAYGDLDHPDHLQHGRTEVRGSLCDEKRRRHSRDVLPPPLRLSNNDARRDEAALSTPKPEACSDGGELPQQHQDGDVLRLPEGGEVESADCSTAPTRHRRARSRQRQPSAGGGRLWWPAGGRVLGWLGAGTSSTSYSGGKGGADTKGKGAAWKAVESAVQVAVATTPEMRAVRARFGGGCGDFADWDGCSVGEVDVAETKQRAVETRQPA
ncbi:hypothetical protein HK405_013398, partial [Cladochytrium tenue]